MRTPSLNKGKHACQRVFPALFALFALLCTLWPAQAEAVNGLPVTFSTNGVSYQYANSKESVADVTYGTKTANKTKGSTSATLTSDGTGVIVSLDTGYNKNFKLCYKEVPVTVTVPANTTYSVTFGYARTAFFKRADKRASATYQALVDDLGEASAAASGVTVKLHWEEHDLKFVVDGDEVDTGYRSYVYPGENADTNYTLVPTSGTLTYDFVNTTGAAKSVTHYLGFLIALQRGSSYENRGTATYTITPEAITCTVSFDPNGGTVSTKSKTVTYNSTYGTLPTPTRAGYTFDGWYTAKTGGTKITSTSTVNNSVGSTLYAHWTAGKYTATLDPNGGTVSTTSKQVTYDSAYGTLPTPTRAGYTFDGWYTAKTGGTQVTAKTVVTATANHTLYARWHLTPAVAPRDVHIQEDRTVPYGKKPVFNLNYGSNVQHTYSDVWYECDANGNNGKLLTEEPKMPNVGVHYYYTIVTATRKDNGLTASTKSNVGKVTVEKATPTIYTNPTASALELTVSRILSGSTLTGGRVLNKNVTPNLDVSGTFTWANDAAKPAVGTGSYAVIFTPDDTVNYNTASTTVSVKVTCKHDFGEWSAGRRTCSVCGATETRTNTVTVTWGALAYTYTDGPWDPATHACKDGSWSVDDADGNMITVRNEGANEAKVTFRYTPTISAISGTLAGDSDATLQADGIAAVRLNLSGKPDRELNGDKIGTITVRLGGD